MKITVMRHSDALSRRDADVPYDADRPLSEVGRDEARAAGAFLRHSGLAPAMIACSPFVRTQETAALVAGELDASAPVVPQTELAPGSGTDDLLRSVEELDLDAGAWALAVLHQPDVGHILGSLLCDGADWPFNVRTSDLFALSIRLGGDELSATLQAFYSASAFAEGQRI